MHKENASTKQLFLWWLGLWNICKLNSVSLYKFKESTDINIIYLFCQWIIKILKFFKLFYVLIRVFVISHFYLKISDVKHTAFDEHKNIYRWIINHVASSCQLEMPSTSRVFVFHATLSHFWFLCCCSRHSRSRRPFVRHEAKGVISSVSFSRTRAGRLA